ncbi:MAG: anhydro-N-acetylmuramic acid kinase [Alphaproteobacteria bacterium]|nr:anhydro-N-acetylmuramic acid kinase [Alphaproteobacteria bacterium]
MPKEEADPAMWALGLMSGTSMDGVDAALIESDGERVRELGPWISRPYPDGFRRRLRAILGGQGDVAGVERELTEFHALTARELLAAWGRPPGQVGVVGFHGHTILHRPEAGRTWQIGDGPRLAAALGIDVVNDLRQADVAAGGQGAPLAPVYHRALAHDLPRPLAVLNIGGVANVTVIDRSNGMLAFDTGPGNALIDDWLLRHTGRAMDEGGAVAAAGRVDTARLARLLDHPYFDRVPPKSLDRDDFSAQPLAGLSLADGAATLVAFTAAAVQRALVHVAEPPGRWLVCGGGRHNPALMAALARELGVPVEPVEAVGWRGDALEAEAFAFMAIRHLLGLPISFPGTTGAPQPMTGGRRHAPAGIASA